MEPGANLEGPPSKAKYSHATDSVIVARVKGEKYPSEGSEIGPETIYLQAVGALWLRKKQCVTACLLHNDPATYRIQQG